MTLVYEEHIPRKPCPTQGMYSTLFRNLAHPTQTQWTVFITLAHHYCWNKMKNIPFTWNCLTCAWKCYLKDITLMSHTQ